MTKREHEILLVKQLGEHMGYGNMMDIASALLAMKLSANGEEQILHVSAVEACMKKESWEQTRLNVLATIEEIKSYGISYGE